VRIIDGANSNVEVYRVGAKFLQTAVHFVTLPSGL
jgi:hypothetical protein